MAQPSSAAYMYHGPLSPNNAGTVNGSSDEVTVLVTGFGPFRQEYPRNPSWLIAESLPPYLPPSPAHPSPIRILVHPSPVRVSYHAVHNLMQTIYGPAAPRVDLVLHIGMAGGRKYYAMESLAHRDGYMMGDVDGKKLDPGYAARVWKGCPMVLDTTVHTEDVWRRWKSALPYADVRPSNDPGRYLCDFIFYSSLAHFYQQELQCGGPVQRPVMFLHVPGEADAEHLRTGQSVAIALIQALVDSWRLHRRAPVWGGQARQDIDTGAPPQQMTQRTFVA